mgnify:CR=1 FL=1
MKKRIIPKILLIFLTAVSLTAKNKNKIFINNIDKNLIIDKKLKVLEEGARIKVNQKKNLVILALLIETKKLDIDFYDQYQRKIIDHDFKESLSRIEQQGTSQITHKIEEVDGKLLIKFYNINDDQDVIIDVKAEYYNDNINDITDIININYVD